MLNNKIKMHCLAALTGAMCVAAGSTHAEGLGWVVLGGLDMGGDTLYTALFNNGTTKKINAGEFLHIDGGVVFKTAPGNPAWESQLTIGYKVDNIVAQNGSVTFSRYPLDMLEFYNEGQWRLGAGLTYHLSPTLTGDGVASGLNVTFDNALGFLAEADYKMGKAYVGGRVTLIDYKVYGITVNGNSLGGVFGYRF